jgi:hemin uptake protein HemP
MAEPGSSSSRQAPDESAPAGASDDDRRVWSTDELLGDQREVLIRHGEDLYRLRITRHGKLILYK